MERRWIGIGDTFLAHELEKEAVRDGAMAGE